MSYEGIKAYLLVILIGISVLLSIALWTYQPNYEQFQDPDYVNEVNIGGKEQDKKDLITPSSIVFHDDQRVLGFNEPTEKNELYESMNTWVMSSPKERDSVGPPNERRFMEIIFPTEIPGKVIPNLFTFNEEINPPNWLFNRILVTFNSNDSSLLVHFISTDEKRELVATIEKAEHYDLLFDYAVDHTNLIDYTRFRTKEKPFYVPNEALDLTSKTLVISKIQPEKLVNALFRDPSEVTPNVAEAYFTDGQRGMSVSKNDNRIEFINPIQTSVEDSFRIDLLEQSIAKINEHKGWTNDYALDDINKDQSKVEFRLMYDGLPVFDRNHLTTIEQKWEGQELFEYNRSLIRLTYEVNLTPKKLISGTELVEFIEERELFNLNEIEDIKVGYELKILPNASDSMLLEPNWYIKTNGKWQLVILDDLAEGGE